jgi:UDP:flavonoid glycosyltransferase YjiC (YdhE family)
MDETGFGVRLPTYGHDSDELRAAVDRQLGDDQLATRLGAVSARLQAAPGTEIAAAHIEALADARA